MKNITMIDYGAGNLLSVKRAFEYWGAQVDLADSAEKIASAQRLVLPGVGAFADGMAALNQLNLADAIKNYAATGKPLLGICLGMQMLFDCSEEFGETQGLELLQGRVQAIPKKGINDQPHKIPHMGWNALISKPSRPWKNTILNEINEETSAVYFVHSFRANPVNPDVCLAHCLYNGIEIPAVVNSGSIYGCQFHPEKSAEVGLQVIKNFLVI